MASQTASVHDTGSVHTSSRRRANRALLRCLCGAVLILTAAATLLSIWYRDEAPRSRDFATPPAARDAVLDSDRAEVTDDAAPVGAAPDARLQALLLQGDYEGAVELYVQAFTRGETGAGYRYREAILRQVSDFIQSGAYADATALLDSYLAVFFRDTEALVYAGRAYRESRQYRPAIEAFLRAAQQDQHPDKLRMVAGQLNWTINLYVQQLREHESYQDIVDLYAYLTQADPRNPHYFIALARAYVAVGRTDDALAALQFVAAEGDAGQEARALIEQIRAGL